ncbi:endogenous retrovirus group S71 member 1 Env polyprotein-like [Antechinus flavipes]|uniref:endogenous retrovirus group S71 member 1 Env polyprotein-like n=1 Tax=Antechinus flavipes TaxID=38775 RepID=UPI00223632C2|nr:endogenous retrovirus group S71 member 1 Env polyprotein-like [Antechinus flavipes]
MLLLLSVLLPLALGNNPYLPTRYNWTLTRTNDGTVVAHNATYGQPVLYFDLCSLLGPGWNIANNWGSKNTMTWSEDDRRWNANPGCGEGVPAPAEHERALRGQGFYVCPSEGPSNCQGKDRFHCGTWGCETIASWQGGESKDPNINLIRRYPGNPTCTVGSCNPMILHVKTWTADYWRTGKSWGLRVYLKGYDNGGYFTLQKTLILTPHLSIGPNPVLNEHVLEGKQASPSPLPAPYGPPEVSSYNVSGRKDNPQALHPGGQAISPTLNTLDAVFAFLNQTSPNLTSSCWLCLSPAPPFFVGLGTTAVLGNNDSSIRKQSLSDTYLGPDPRCRGNHHQPVLTLQDVEGSATCLASPDFQWSLSPYKEICQFRLQVSPTDHSPNWLFAPEATWFACTTGLTPCISELRFRQNTELCILVHVLPQVFLYSAEGAEEHFGLIRSTGAVPMLVPLLVGIGVAGSAAVGTAALDKGNAGFNLLSSQVDVDIRTLENLITHLEKSVGSLAEVVLQNRRRLDLLFMKQGGLCMALGQLCCFYANRSGVIRESLASRETSRKASQSWYESLYDRSPWLTTLLSGLAGPILLFLLLLLIAPCIIKCLSSYIQDRIQALKVSALRMTYSLLALDESQL